MTAREQGVTTVRDDDLFAWWQASVQRAYKVAKSRHTARLHGRHASIFDRDGEDPFSAAMGRAQMAENLMPDLFNLWVVDNDPRRSDAPDKWSKAKLVDEAARRDAEAEFRNEILLGALAKGEVVAPVEQAA